VKAFPNMTNEKGMDLRDYFAAKALQGFLAKKSSYDLPREELVAQSAYAFADAMMEIRGKKWRLASSKQ
jgi:hypothetical protein